MAAQLARTTPAVACHSSRCRASCYTVLPTPATLRFRHAAAPLSTIVAAPVWPAQARFRLLTPPRAMGSSAADDAGAAASLEEAFAAELAARSATEAAAAEAAAAASFDGAALLALLRAKYSRSYDVTLVQRTYLGKVFVALNVMWRYKEQQSFTYSEEEYMQRLDYVAAALRSWGAVSTVRTQLTATRERPRVGKAVSIMLDVPEEKFREFV